MGEKRSRIFRGGHTYSCSQTGTAKLACCSVVRRFAVVSCAAAPTGGLDCLMFPQARPSKTDIPLRRCQMNHPLFELKIGQNCDFRTGGEILKIITTCKSLNEIDKQTFRASCNCAMIHCQIVTSNACNTCLSYCIV